MAEIFYDVAFVAVVVSGLVVGLIEARRRVPWSGHPWSWFVDLKSVDAEWPLLLAGIALIVIGGISDSSSRWVLFAAIPVWAGVVVYLRARPGAPRPGPGVTPDLAPTVSEPMSNVIVDPQ